MIISASRRTDIPAYFGENFYNNLKQGHFKIVNPFNNKTKIIRFNKSDIDGIVFWTKNPYPFFTTIKKIKDEGYRFYFQYTLNNYPKTVEPLKFSLDERINHLKQLYEIIYPEKIFWRYDPIILNKTFNITYHIESFEYILSKINIFIEQIIVSFLTVYRKIKKFFCDIIEEKETQIKLLKNLSEISKKYNKKLYICCYNENLEKLNIFASKCVNASYFGISSQKHVGQRKLCKCSKSIDIGYYRTCKTGCIYCYAN